MLPCYADICFVLFNDQSRLTVCYFPFVAYVFQVVLHFAELYWQGENQRLFDVTIEEAEFTHVDIVKLGGGARLKAFTIESAQIVSDGFLSIGVANAVPAVDQGKKHIYTSNTIGKRWRNPS